MKFLLSHALLAGLLVCTSCDFIKSPHQGGETAEEEISGKDGLQTSYWEDGRSVRSQVNYQNGIKHGQARQFYRNGKQQMEINYVNGSREGITKVFYEDGNLYRESPYVNDQLNGIQLIYHPNGQVAAEIPYRNDEPGIGLKEYNAKGDDVSDSPKIIFTVDNQLKAKNKYIVYLSFEGKNRAPEFWFGAPIEGRFLDTSEHVPIAKEGNRYYVEYEVPQGRRLITTLEVIGQMKSKYKNPYLAAGTLEIDVANR